MSRFGLAAERSGAAEGYRCAQEKREDGVFLAPRHVWPSNESTGVPRSAHCSDAHRVQLGLTTYGPRRLGPVPFAVSSALPVPAPQPQAAEDDEGESRGFRDQIELKAVEIDIVSCHRVAGNRVVA